MKKFVLLPILLLAFIATACSSKKTVTNNYYDDGIYYDPSQDEGSFTLGDIRDPETTTQNSSGEYYDPNTYSNTGDVIVNNYYSNPTLRYPQYNTGLYWNNWGSFGIYTGFGWGNPYSFYDPFFYDPWYNPYWGWDPYYSYYNPYRWRGNCWTGGWGYNSYWAGYYTGYYYGSNDAWRSNRVYTGYIPSSARSGSYNNYNRSIYNRRNITNGNVINRNGNIAGGNVIGRGKNAMPAPSRTRIIENSRNKTINNGRGTTSRNTAITNTPRRTPEGNTNNISQSYNRNTYEMMKQRSNSESSLNERVININRNSPRSSGDANTSRQEPRSISRPVQRTPVRSTDKNEYFRRNTPDRTPETQPRERTDVPQRRNPAVTTPPVQRNPRTVEPREPVNNTPSRTTTPRRSSPNVETPQRSSGGGSYTPSRTNTPSRASTPSRSSTPSRASTPARRSSGGSTGGSNTPSRRR